MKVSIASFDMDLAKCKGKGLCIANDGKIWIYVTRYDVVYRCDYIPQDEPRWHLDPPHISYNYYKYWFEQELNEDAMWKKGLKMSEYTRRVVKKVWFEIWNYLR